MTRYTPVISSSNAHLSHMSRLTDYPRQPSLDRRDGLIQVVTVKTHSSLEPERISRTQARQLHARTKSDFFGNGNGGIRRQRNLSRT